MTETDFKLGDEVIVDGAGWYKVKGTVRGTDGGVWKYEVHTAKGKVGLFHAHELKLVKPEAEAVDGPAHYGGKDNPYEVIKVAEAWGFNENAYLFNALKYLGRAGKKGSKVEDLKKLVFYVEREIALEEAK